MFFTRIGGAESYNNVLMRERAVATHGHEISDRYVMMSNDDLLRVAADRDILTTTAREALAEELRKRVWTTQMRSENMNASETSRSSREKSWLLRFGGRTGHDSKESSIT
jgi:hypothetical protein